MKRNSDYYLWYSDSARASEQEQQDHHRSNHSLFPYLHDYNIYNEEDRRGSTQHRGIRQQNYDEKMKKNAEMMNPYDKHPDEKQPLPWFLSFNPLDSSMIILDEKKEELEKFEESRLSRWSAKSDQEHKGDFFRFPFELITIIAKNLTPTALVALMSVNKYFYCLLSRNEFWEPLYHYYWSVLDFERYQSYRLRFMRRGQLELSSKGMVSLISGFDKTLTRCATFSTHRKNFLDIQTRYLRRNLDPAYISPPDEEGMEKPLAKLIQAIPLLFEKWRDIAFKEISLSDAMLVTYNQKYQLFSKNRLHIEALTSRLGNLSAFERLSQMRVVIGPDNMTFFHIKFLASWFFGFKKTRVTLIDNLLASTDFNAQIEFMKNYCHLFQSLQHMTHAVPAVSLIFQKMMPFAEPFKILLQEMQVKSDADYLRSRLREIVFDDSISNAEAAPTAQN